MTIIHGEVESIVGTRTVYGYLRKGFLMNATEVANLRKSILEYGSSQGMHVTEIYEEELDRASEELNECVRALLNGDERFLIIPSLLHLAALGNPLDVRRDFQSQGIQVLLAQDLPGDP